MNRYGTYYVLIGLSHFLLLRIRLSHNIFYPVRTEHIISYPVRMEQIIFYLLCTYSTYYTIVVEVHIYKLRLLILRLYAQTRSYVFFALKGNHKIQVFLSKVLYQLNCIDYFYK